MNARKETLGEVDALAIAKTVSKIYAAKGRKVVYFDMKKDAPSEDELKKVMLGPTGNLRAPALRIGKTLIIGFNDETYSQVLA